MQKEDTVGDNSKRSQRFMYNLRKKLLVLFLIILVAFVCLSMQLYRITAEDGERYKKQILSQQKYDSVTIPFKRGDILDANGMVLATSNKVYNVILDAKLVLSDEKYLEPTLAALRTEFGLDTSVVREYITNNPSSQYYVLAKRLSYEAIQGFVELQNDTENEESKLIKGIWFEEEYQRQYPNNTLACDVIGFTTNDNAGTYGLEAYYNDVLSGQNGREYGYLTEGSTLERTVIPAVDGYTIVSTIDSNIQRIVEKCLLDFNDQYKDNVHEGNGAENVGCIIMEVDTGNVLAMASYPNYDLNNPRDTSAMIGMRQVDIKGNKNTGKEYEVEEVIEEDEEAEVENEAEETEESSSTEEETSEESQEPKTRTVKKIDPKYVTEETIAQMDDELLYQNLNALWKNFCINDTYEPGSVAKPFTVASALDAGKITGNESYNCEGFLHVGDYDIKCHNVYGDGYLTVAQSIERSCNVALMNMAFAQGKETFIKYQHNFGFGLKTNIDLAGESRTASLVYSVDNMGPTDLATNSFGQGYNVTMIQMIAGFCSLINGGNYYEPHMVSKILSSDGATIENIEPRLLKQTISPSTSEKIVEYCNTVVTGEYGTGKTARPAGYMIGGKTGTAQTLPRGNGEYVVSFMGYAPADDPQIAIYVVVDRPNVLGQDDAKHATRIVRNVLTEVLPYLRIYMTEELSEKEIQELKDKKLEITYQAQEALGNVETPTEDETEGTAEATEAQPEEGTEATEEQTAQQPKAEEPWKQFPVDLNTGYAIDPNTGAWVDPTTGAVVKGGTADLPDMGDDNIATGRNQSAVGDEPDTVQ